MNDGLFLDEKKLSAMTSLSLSKLRRDRFLGIGIPYVKMGRNVRYDIRDVKAYVDSRRVQTGTKTEKAGSGVVVLTQYPLS